MDRRTRRKIEQQAKKRLDKLELEKKAIAKKVVQMGHENPFNEVSVVKKFGPVIYSKTGLKLAPLRRILFLGCSISHRYDTFILSVFKYHLVIKDWTMRRKTKPKGSIWNYTIKFLKHGKEKDAL